MIHVLSTTPPKRCGWKTDSRQGITMCKDCLKERLPNRGTTCLEAGSYLLNYAGCSQCKKLGIIVETNRVMNQCEDDDEEETIEYEHVCCECGHLIARHKYMFSTDEEFQEYTMECDLCGWGQDTASILPDDPRGKELF